MVRVAEVALGFPKGELAKRYESLNRGQRRMNAGNRIRAAVKREALTEAEIKAAIGKS